MWFRALRVTESGTRPKPFGALIFDKRIVNNDGWRSTTRDAANQTRLRALRYGAVNQLWGAMA